MNLVKLAKDWGVHVILLGLLTVGISDHFEIKNALAMQKKIDEQAAQIVQLWKSQVHSFNDLNDLAKRVHAPGYPWPDDLR